MDHPCFKGNFLFFIIGRRRAKIQPGFVQLPLTSWDNQNASRTFITGRILPDENICRIPLSHFSCLLWGDSSGALPIFYPVSFSLWGSCGSKRNPALRDNKGMIIVFGWLNQNSLHIITSSPTTQFKFWIGNKMIISVLYFSLLTLSGQNQTYLNGFILKCH